MRATDVLEAEHRVIDRVLACLETITERCSAEGRLDGSAARQAVDFFENFADRCHHGKEERHFLPAVEAKGFPRERGPSGVLLAEHEQGRRHLRAVAASIDRAAVGKPDAVRRFTENARAYVCLLREHIAKEDHGLFPVANQLFSPAEQQQIVDAFAHVEEDEMHAGTHEKYLYLADALAASCGVEPAAARRPCCSCSGH